MTKEQQLLNAVVNNDIEKIKILISKNVDLNIVDEKGFPLLSIACELNHKEIVQILIDAKVDLEAGNLNKSTALHIAAFYNHWEILQILINAGSDLNSQGIDGSIPLNIASQEGYAKIVKILIKVKADVNKTDERGDSPLMFAAQNGHTNIVKMFIKANVDVNMTDKQGDSALKIAAQNGHIEIVKMLLKANADVNIINEKGISALIPAALNGHTKIVKMLLIAKADVNITNEHNITTALIAASHNGHTKIVEILIKANANINSADKYGTTPLIVACRYGHFEIVELLIEAKADVNEADQKGASALILASQNGYIDIVRTLVINNANVNIVDKIGTSALMLASSNGHLRIVKFLTYFGANVNQFNDSKSNALNLATHQNYIEIVKFLACVGADLNYLNDQGQTALMMATILNFQEIAQILITAKANLDLISPAGNTALTLAVNNLNPVIVKMLIMGGTSLNGINNPNYKVLDIIDDKLKSNNEFSEIQKNNIFLIKKYIDSVKAADEIFYNEFSQDRIPLNKNFKDYDSDIFVYQFMHNTSKNIGTYYSWDNNQLTELFNKIPNIPEKRKEEIFSKLWSIRDEFNLNVSSLITQVYNIESLPLLEFINLRYKYVDEDLTDIPAGIKEMVKFYSSHSDLKYEDIISQFEKPTLTNEEIASLKFSIFIADIHILKINPRYIIDKIFENNYFDDIENIFKFPTSPFFYESKLDFKDILYIYYSKKCKELFNKLLSNLNVYFEINEKEVNELVNMRLPSKVSDNFSKYFPAYKQKLKEIDEEKYKLFHELSHPKPAMSQLINNNNKLSSEKSTENIILHLNNTEFKNDEFTKVELTGEEE